MDTSSTSSSFSFSDVDVCNITTVKQKKKSKYLRRGLSLITKKYKPNIRKISKDDVMNHGREFSKWLVSEENVKPDGLGDKHRDALFRKFVKKWNGKKLPQNYYVEADSLWVSTSPQVEQRPSTTPQHLAHKPAHGMTSKVGDSWSQLAISTPTDSSSFSHLSFGTFGKKSGAAALRELQAGSILSRRDCTEPANRCSAAAGGTENITFIAEADVTSHDEQSAMFERGDAKRAGVRRAFTICRTAL